MDTLRNLEYLNHLLWCRLIRAKTMSLLWAQWSSRLNHYLKLLRKQHLRWFYPQISSHSPSIRACLNHTSKLSKSSLPVIWKSQTTLSIRLVCNQTRCMHQVCSLSIPRTCKLSWLPSISLRYIRARYLSPHFIHTGVLTWWPLKYRIARTRIVRNN